MSRVVIFVCVFILLAPAPARAMPYYPDPVYAKLNDQDFHPMADILDMAGAGDVRAQFIIGDLYSKGKGGLEKDEGKARHWLEQAAMHGEGHAFLRLAAMAKRDKKPLEAWQWYTLALADLEGRDQSYAAAARAALADDHHFSADDLATARKAVAEWKKQRDAALAEEEKKAAAEKRNAAASDTPGAAEAAPSSLAHQGGVNFND